MNVLTPLLLSYLILSILFFSAICATGNGCYPIDNDNIYNEPISADELMRDRVAGWVTDFIDTVLNRMPIAEEEDEDEDEDEDENEEYPGPINDLDDNQINLDFEMDNLPVVFDSEPNETLDYFQRVDVLVQAMQYFFERDEGTNSNEEWEITYEDDSNADQEQETTHKEDSDTDEEKDAIPEEVIKTIKLIAQNQINNEESSDEEDMSDTDNDEQDMHQGDYESDDSNDDDDQDDEGNDDDDNDEDENYYDDYDNDKENEDEEDEENEEDGKKKPEKKDEEDKDEDEKKEVEENEQKQQK